MMWAPRAKNHEEVGPTENRRRTTKKWIRLRHMASPQVVSGVLVKVAHTPEERRTARAGSGAKHHRKVGPDRAREPVMNSAGSAI